MQIEVVVLVVNNLLPRGQWPLALVTATHPDEFGKVHHVTLRNALGRMFDRPVNKCVLLELTAED